MTFCAAKAVNKPDSSVFTETEITVSFRIDVNRFKFNLMTFNISKC